MEIRAVGISRNPIFVVPGENLDKFIFRCICLVDIEKLRSFIPKNKYTEILMEAGNVFGAGGMSITVIITRNCNDTIIII